MGLSCPEASQPPGLEKGEYKDPCLYKKEEYEKGKLENFINIIKSEGDMLLSEADKNSLLKYLNI